MSNQTFSERIVKTFYVSVYSRDTLFLWTEYKSKTRYQFDKDHSEAKTLYSPDQYRIVTAEMSALEKMVQK